MDRIKSLAYNCFLCGKCKAVCPIGIDGQDIFYKLRVKEVENNEGKMKGHSFLRAEKSNYIFKNKRKVNGRSLLFPGCNFPSYYPETTKKLIKVMEEHGIGTWIDCCGKPIGELGLLAKEKKIIERLEKYIQENHIDEVITVCPNCYFFLEGKLQVKISNIYDKLLKLGIKKEIEGNNVFFTPCPDREEGRWLNSISQFMKEPPEKIERVQCCGLGGCAAKNEPELAKSFALKVKEELKEREEREKISMECYVYCGSCGGQFTRNSVEKVKHILSEILNVSEKADFKKSLTNRAKFKFYKG